jgi:hypothetical protein
MLDRQPRHASPEWCPATQGKTPFQRGEAIVAIAAGGSIFRPERRLLSQPRTLFLGPADRNGAGDERAEAPAPEPVSVAVSGEKHAEGDEQADIYGKHHAALLRARRPPTLAAAVLAGRQPNSNTPPPTGPARRWLQVGYARGCHFGRQDRGVTPVGLRSVPIGGSSGRVFAVRRGEWRSGQAGGAGGMRLAVNTEGSRPVMATCSLRVGLTLLADAASAPLPPPKRRDGSHSDERFTSDSPRTTDDLRLATRRTTS